MVLWFTLQEDVGLFVDGLGHVAVPLGLLVRRDRRLLLTVEIGEERRGHSVGLAGERRRRVETSERMCDCL